MRFGIPKYRLPRNILDAEIARIGNKGVTIRLNTRVDDLAAMMTDGLRRRISSRLERTSPSALIFPLVMRARSWMRSACCATWTEGDLPSWAGACWCTAAATPALDAARTAKRLGATETIIVYRRTREKMPAHDFEVREASRRRHPDQMVVHHQGSR